MFTLDDGGERRDRTDDRPVSGRRPPQVPEPRPVAESKKLNLATFKARFASRGTDTSDRQLAHFLDVGERISAESLFGQDHIMPDVSRAFCSYAADCRNKDTPIHVVAFAGLSGTGKTRLARTFPETLGWDVTVTSLQGQKDMGGATSQSFDFVKALNSYTNRNRPWVVVAEEPDKVEGTANGVVVPSSTLGFINAILDGTHGVSNTIKPLVVLSLNLGAAYDGLSSDPDLTTIEDIIRLHERAFPNRACLLDAMESVMSDHTARRLYPKTFLFRPLNRPAFSRVIDHTLESTLRNLTSKGAARITWEFTESLKLFLQREAVLPKVQGRGTVDRVEELITPVYLGARDRIPRGKAETAPLHVTFDYNRANSEIVGQVSDSPAGSVKNFETYIFRTRPVLHREISPMPGGQLPTNDELLTATEEFGHAYTCAFLGIPFKVIRTVTDGRSEGRVIGINPRESLDLIHTVWAEVLTLLGGRALQRIIYGKLSPGSSGDVHAANTILLQSYALCGLDPGSGPRMEGSPGSAPVLVPAVSATTMKTIADQLQRAEDHLVKVFLKANPTNWFADKIYRLARERRMEEADFYRLIGLEPLLQGREPAINAPFRAVFPGGVEASEATLAGERTKIGRPLRTPVQNFEAAMREILQLKGSVRFFPSR